jgi:hypothetical protein
MKRVGMKMVFGYYSFQFVRVLFDVVNKHIIQVPNSSLLILNRINNFINELLYEWAFVVFLQPSSWLYLYLPEPIGWGGLDKIEVCSRIKRIERVLFETVYGASYCDRIVAIQSSILFIFIGLVWVIVYCKPRISFS